ncbi:phosphomannomutase [Candidatus Dojkabacteria bacterium]|nr:phosphomannomutase [Candidatus Dojkabacteria bacterium]
MSKFSKKYLEEVFRAYDIRGTVPDQLNVEFFEELGRAFVQYLDAKSIAVGRDFRGDSLDFQQAFIRGAASVGCNVWDVGEIGTEMIYYVCGENEILDGGATITASHNPAGWNGCKMVGKKARAISGNSGLKEIMNLMLKSGPEDDVLDATGGDSVSEGELGKIEKVNIYPQFREKILSFLEGTDIKRLKIAIDAGNGIGGQLFNYVFGDLPLEVIEMYFEPDGSFPNHEANPSKEENVAEIKKRVVSEEADLGIAIDGDADRVFFIDEKGRNPSGVYSGPLLARNFLQGASEKVIHDPRVIWSVAKEIEALGGIPVACQAGHSFFKDKMKSLNAIMGIEMSSHFFYRDFYYADSGMVTIAVMLKLLSEGLDFTAEIDRLYESYPNSGEVNYDVDHADQVLSRVEAAYDGYEIDKIDGISVETDDWRFNLRKSNTQPVVRLNVEGKDVETIVEVFKKVEELIGGTRRNIPGLGELVP